jgi:hypothetical protein
MTTSQTEFLSDILDGEAIPDSAFVYFRGDLLNQAHSLLLKAWLKRHTEEGLSQKDFADRIHRTAAVVNRHIAVAGNWELTTVADYLLGLRARLVLSLVFLEDLRESDTVQLTPITLRPTGVQNVGDLIQTDDLAKHFAPPKEEALNDMVATLMPRSRPPQPPLGLSK